MSMIGIHEQASRTVHQHGLLTADFKTSGIDPSTFGFYDQPAFLARENADPSYLARYAEWVLTRPMSAEYEAHVRATVPKLAHLLGTAFATYGARGRCVAASSMMTRMLDRLHVWSFGIFGSVNLEVPALGLRRAIHTIAFNGHRNGIVGHAWVCAPPFIIVDPTLGLQHWDPAIAPLIPNVILADAQARKIDARVEDCVNYEVIAMFAQTEGWHDPHLHYRLNPSLRGFLRSFPPRAIIAEDLRMRFIPVEIRQPDEALAQIELDGEGRSGRTIWNSFVGPAFGLAPLP